MVDIVRQVSIEVAQGVIGQSSQMYHRVESHEVRLRKIADVFTNLRHTRDHFPELTAHKQACIEADHFMARGTQDGSRNCADIAFMAGQQYSHVTRLSKIDVSLR